MGRSVEQRRRAVLNTFRTAAPTGLPPSLAGVPALTLQPPWSHAVAHFGKNVENRTWKPSAGVTRILIHAGQKWSTNGDVCFRAWGLDVPRNTVVMSAIVAVADIAGVCTAAAGGVKRCKCGRWAAAGHNHWRLDPVWTLAQPVPCAGRQGLWRPAPDVLLAVEVALAASVREAARA